MVWLLLGTGALAGVYLVTQTGQQTQDASQAKRVCGVPSLGPAAFYSALGVPLPTAEDGTGTGTCMLPNDLEDMLRKARIAAGVLPTWRAAGLTAAQCAAGRLAVEFGDGLDGGWSTSHEEIIRACGPAPSADSTATIERLNYLPGTSVRILETYGPFTNSSYPVLTRWTQPYPASVTAAMDCACASTQPDAGACSVADAGAPTGVTLAKGAWSGPGCVKKPCVEPREVVDQQGLGYSMPAVCK
jgi:hypothetical protein